MADAARSLRSNLFEYPAAKVVGYSVFDTKNEQTLKSTCLFTGVGKSINDLIEDTMKNAAKDMADQFLIATRTEKQGKEQYIARKYPIEIVDSRKYLSYLRLSGEHP